MNGPLFTVADDVTLWVADGGSIQIRTRERYGDPVELTAAEAIELATILTRLAEQLRE